MLLYSVVYTPANVCIYGHGRTPRRCIQHMHLYSTVHKQVGWLSKKVWNSY